MNSFNRWLAKGESEFERYYRKEGQYYLSWMLWRMFCKSFSRFFRILDGPMSFLWWAFLRFIVCGLIGHNFYVNNYPSGSCDRCDKEKKTRCV